MQINLPSSWIPHLKNPSTNSSIIVKTKTFPIPQHFTNAFFDGTDEERMLFVKLHVNVDFYSELDVDMRNPIPAPPVNSTRPFRPAGDPSCMAAWLREVFLERVIPFPLDSCTLIEDGRPGRSVSGEDELLDAVSDFFLKGSSELEVGRLEVKKSVVLPERVFGAWVTWYAGLDRVDPDYEELCEKTAIRKSRFLPNQDDESLERRFELDGDRDYVRVFRVFLDSI